MTADVTIDQASAARVNRMINQAVLDTGRTVEQATTWGALTVAESIRARCKPSKKNRDIIDNPEWKQAQGSFAWARAQMKAGKAIPAEAQEALQRANEITPFLIVRLRQPPKQTVMVPSYSKTDPRRVIENRGLAKKIANIGAAKLAAEKNTSGNFNMVSGQSLVSRRTAQYGSKTRETAVRVANRLSYLRTAYPGIEQQALSAGLNRLQKKVEQDAARIAQRANAAA